jgi:hypothetical protein
MRIPDVQFPVAALALFSVFPVMADEGLWPWNQFPHDAIKTKYSFDATPAFLDHLRQSSVRIGGRAGSFVSATGLIATDRLTAHGCLPSVENSFIAPTSAAEVKCAGMDAMVLLSIEDVSAQLKTPDKQSEKQTLAQRNAAIARIEKDCAAKTGNVCSVVRLFSGGRYDLYRYKRYSDIRLVFAPEYSAAFFGRERDSISYLRYGLDVAFLRAWENGRPAHTPDYLKWSAEGVKDGDLVFASGDPGPTSRLATAAQLTFYRDTSLPLEVGRLQTRIQLLAGVTGAQTTLTPLLNTFKTEAGKLIGLRDDRLVTRKTNFEGKIKRALETDPKLGTDATKVWDEVAAAYKKWAPFEKPYQVLEAAPAPGSRLFRNARAKLRGEAPDASPEPVNKDVEVLMLTQYLDELRILGDKESPLKTILGGNKPKQAAEAMVQAPDGVSKLAELIEPQAQKLRRQHEEIIGALEVSAAEKIAQYRFRLFGATDYPEGTSTPRVEFGMIEGYTDRAAVAQPFASTFSGLFYRRNNEGPWQVSQQWVDARTALGEVVPLDFVSTCDTGGGDYGSPVVNRAGELVGITFDGNLESLPNVFLYAGDQARAVHVDARGIVEALDKVYKAGFLLRELGVAKGPGVS